MTTKKPITASVWDCKVCVDQMFTGQRCLEHNPLPADDRPHVLKAAGVRPEPIMATVVMSLGMPG